jgi:FlaG/FlaF family flagellin (archaellin)
MFRHLIIFREKHFNLNLHFGFNLQGQSNMARFYRSFRAISPVLAVLMMIAVAIAGSLVVYAWVMGYIDLSTEKSGQAITIQSIANSDADLLVYVQNTGEGVAQLEEAACLYVNGQLVDCSISGVPVSAGVATLGEGETATLRYVGGAAPPGQKVDAKVTTVLGVPSELSDYPAGKVRVAPVLHHLEFSHIPSPQTSGVPFNFTVSAVDQYGDVFTSFNGGFLVYPSSEEGDVQIVHGMTHSAFLCGVETFNMTLSGSATNVTIGLAAMPDFSCRGTSNPFDLVMNED